MSIRYKQLRRRRYWDELLYSQIRTIYKLYCDALEKDAPHKFDSGRLNFRWFAFHVPRLWRRLREWDRNRSLYGGTLTDCAWHVAGEVYALKRSGGLRLMGFNEHEQRCYLRFGLICLCKILIDYDPRSLPPSPQRRN